MTPSRPSPWVRLDRRILAIGFTLALALCASPGAATAAELRAATAADQADVATPEGLLTWISRHPANAGLALLPDRGGATIGFGADRRYPLASTRKVLIAGALTAGGTNLARRVPRREVERFYVPGTDGGAHERARLDPQRPTLRQLLRATIEVSDNATADALLARLGAARVDAWARRQGLTHQDPIYPGLGEFAAWTRESEWTQHTPAQRAQIARRLGREVPPAGVTLPPIGDQRRLAARSVAGTPAEWARLMRGIGRHGARALVTTLDWPRRRSANLARRFDRFLTKGGRLAGVITEASYVRPAGQPGTAIALFLRDLPPAIEQTLAKTFAQQDLIMKLATDRAFRTRAQRVLRRG